MGVPMKKKPVKASLGSGRRGRARPQVRGRRGSAQQGATRKREAPARRTGKPSVWLNRVLIMLGAGVVLVAATRAWLTVEAIPVQRITVTGELEHTQAEAVQAMVQPSLAGGFLKADLQQMRRQLEGLPWIYEATVRRRWPNALEINVVEQLPIARWGEDGFLNHEGGVFRSGKSGDWESLPLLAGPPGSAPLLVARYQRLREILAPLNLSVRQLAMDERGQLEAVLGGGMQLVLGGEEFLERMQRFVAIYRRELAPRAGQVERVDMRYASGLAVAFAETSSVAGL